MLEVLEMIKLVASDLDGTIIDKNNSIYDNNFKAIQDLNKHKMNFVICTGKTYPITKKVCQRINATYGIFGNGNQIINLKTGEEIYRNLLSRDIVLKCIDIAKRHGLHVHIYTDTNVISEELLYLDLRNYKLQTNTKSENSMEFNIVDNIFPPDHTFLPDSRYTTFLHTSKYIADQESLLFFPVI